MSGDAGPLVVTMIFMVDATGDTIALDTYTAGIQSPPADGRALSIAGNHVSLGDWSPNSIWMKDDGVAPDQVAGDNIWTYQIQALAGADLRYKYTCGSAADEGTWSGSEEFPLYERGYTVPQDGVTHRVTIHDIFADRPMPSGTMGPNSQVEEMP